MAGITKPGDDLRARLRQFTPARLGLGRVGGSLPTRALLDFEIAHARARDAVHNELDVDQLVEDLRNSGFGKSLLTASEARDRREYLLRPDRGRRLAVESRSHLTAAAAQMEPGGLAIVVADGLSALAIMRHAVPLLREVRSSLPEQKLTIVVAQFARVALGDEIGALLQASAVAVLIGERPGLSSPDSLGVYLTWAPRPGRADAERNCLSNIRPEGLGYAEAARRLTYLLGEASKLGRSGVDLKDDSAEPAAIAAGRGPASLHSQE